MRSCLRRCGQLALLDAAGAQRLKAPRTFVWADARATGRIRAQRAAVCGQRASRRCRSAVVQDAVGGRGEGGGGGWGSARRRHGRSIPSGGSGLLWALVHCRMRIFECCAAAQLLPFLYFGDGETVCLRRWVGLEKEVRGERGGGGGARRRAGGGRGSLVGYKRRLHGCSY